MGIDLAALTTLRGTSGDIHASVVRPEIKPLAPSMAATAPSLLGGATLDEPDGVETRQWAAGFPSRARAGQILSGSNAFGTEVSPINTPEAIRGRMVAISI